MKKNSFLYVLRLTLTLLAITAVMAAALAGINKMTKDKIRSNTEEKRKMAVEAVMPDSQYAMDDTERVRYMLEEELPEGIAAVYRGMTAPPSCLPEKDGKPTGQTALEVVVSGFDGEITMMVGIDKNGRVLAVRVVSHTETAGLGAVAAAQNAKGQAFRDQFVGKTGQLAVTKDGGDVDAITGATVTSRAVTEGVNRALACYEYLQEQGVW